MDPETRGWLVGILEGEGSFCVQRTHKHGKEYIYPALEVRMVDKDIIDRVAQLLGANKVVYSHPPARQNRGWQPQYRARVVGKKAEALMRELKPYFGKRRQKQIESAFEKKRKREDSNL